MSSTPNVLVVRQSVNQTDIKANTVRVSFPPNDQPNLKKNKAYYLTFFEPHSGPGDPVIQAQFRVYHIVSAAYEGSSEDGVEEHAMEFKLGNSFVVDVSDPVFLAGRSYIYLSLAAFGLHQLSPGMLVNIKRSVTKNPTGGQ